MVTKTVTRALIGICTITSCAVLSVLACAGDAASQSQTSTAKNLLVRDLAGASGKEVRMLTVDYRPGGASLPHRHNAQVFVYVLAGSVKMQVTGSPVVTLGPGETFYEGPDDVHTVSANASQTEPARILVVMVRDKNTPLSTEVPPKERP